MHINIIQKMSCVEATNNKLFDWNNFKQLDIDKAFDYKLQKT